MGCDGRAGVEGLSGHDSGPREITALFGGFGLSSRRPREWAASVAPAGSGDEGHGAQAVQELVELFFPGPRPGQVKGAFTA